MRTERPVGSTGTGLQEMALGGDDHPRRTAVTVQLTDADLAALQAQAPSRPRITDAGSFTQLLGVLYASTASPSARSASAQSPPHSS